MTYDTAVKPIDQGNIHTPKPLNPYISSEPERTAMTGPGLLGL